MTVTVPDEFMGDIIGDLNSRRGKVLGAEPKGTGQQVIRAQVPMAEVLRYAPDLRSMTQGRGDFEIELAHYEEVPPHIAERLVKKLAQRRVSASREKAFARPYDYVMTYFEREKVRTGIYRRDEFLAGMKLRTPCIVTEYSATTLIPSKARARVDRYGNLIIEATT